MAKKKTQTPGEQLRRMAMDLHANIILGDTDLLGDAVMREVVSQAHPAEVGSEAVPRPIRDFDRVGAVLPEGHPWVDIRRNLLRAAGDLEGLATRLDAGSKARGKAPQFNRVASFSECRGGSASLKKRSRSRGGAMSACTIAGRRTRALVPARRR
jgi:hypothetical protein